MNQRWPGQPPPDQMILARKHLRTLALAQQRPALRQQLRLFMLRVMGWRYGQQSISGPAPVSSQRVLVIRPDHLGDMLFAMPALRRLRASLPQAHITALVGPWNASVVARSPDVDRVLSCAFPGFTRQAKGSPLAPYRLLLKQARVLRSEHFDTVLILRFDHWWGAWLAAEAGIPRRIGYDVPEVRPFLSEPIPYLPGRHEVIQNLALVLAAVGDETGRQREPGHPGGFAANSSTPPGKGEVESQNVPGGWQAGLLPLHFPVTTVEEQAAEHLLGGVRGEGPLVAVHAGSGAAIKRWRHAAWARVISELIVQLDARIIFTGSAAEETLVSPILDALSAEARASMATSPLSLMGQTALGVLAAVYRRCDLVIGPDSGPLHLAVATGVPTVHLYGPVDERMFGPWGSLERHRIVKSTWQCAPCNRLDWPDEVLSEHGCVRDVEVQQVLREALDLLSTAGGMSSTASREGPADALSGIQG